MTEWQLTKMTKCYFSGLPATITANLPQPPPSLPQPTYHSVIAMATDLQTGSFNPQIVSIVYEI